MTGKAAFILWDSSRSCSGGAWREQRSKVPTTDTYNREKKQPGTQKNTLANGQIHRWIDKQVVLASS